MLNEIIFFLYILFISSSLLLALFISKEALVSLISLQVILSNLFVIKEIELFNLTATASDAFAIGVTLGLNLIQEYFSKKEATKAVFISFYLAIFYFIVSKLHLLYISTLENISVSEAFNIILGSNSRIIISSLIVYLIVENLDCIIYGYLINKLKKRYFILRNYGSIIITQFLDTVLFSFLALYKLNESFNSVGSIVQIIIVSYTIKLIAVFISAPYLVFSKKIFNRFNNKI